MVMTAISIISEHMPLVASVHCQPRHLLSFSKHGQGDPAHPQLLTTTLYTCFGSWGQGTWLKPQVMVSGLQKFQ